VGKDLVSLVAPTIMAILFVAVVVVIIRAQNPRRREEARRREREAEAADPRFHTERHHAS
jgi:hypothetical protein